MREKGLEQKGFGPRSAPPSLPRMSPTLRQHYLRVGFFWYFFDDNVARGPRNMKTQRHFLQMQSDSPMCWPLMQGRPMENNSS